jgi:hypothetical protein
MQETILKPQEPRTLPSGRTRRNKLLEHATNFLVTDLFTKTYFDPL